MIKDPTAVQDTIIESMKIVADGLISKLQFDTTIEAEITSIINLDAGTYKFKYNDGIFTAWADLQKGDTFDVGDRVYIKIPQGDFSKTPRYIEGLVSNSSLSANEVNKLQNSISEISPSLEQFYSGFNPSSYVKDENGEYKQNEDGTFSKIEEENYIGDRYTPQYEWGLVAGDREAEKDEEGNIIPERYKVYSEKYILGDSNVAYDPSSGANISFQQYINQNILQVAAEFHTNLVKQHTKGNYGLEISFFVKDEAESDQEQFLVITTEGEIENNQTKPLVTTTKIRMDYNTFSGNPYNFTAWAEQDELFDVPVNSLLGIQYIKFFQEDFDYDEEIAMVKAKLEEGIIEIDNPNYSIQYMYNDKEVEYIYKIDETGQVKYQYKWEDGLDAQGNLVYKYADTPPPNSKIVYVKNITENNIFVKNISVKFIEQKNLIDGVYYVNYKAINGQGFNDIITSLTLEAQLVYNRKNILTKDNAIVKWYKKNPTIDLASEYYDKTVGVGWQNIWSESEKNAYEKDVKPYPPEVVDNAKLMIEKNQVDFTNYYKFAIVYQDTVLLSEEIPVYNLSQPFPQPYMEQDATPEGMVLRIGPTPILTTDGGVSLNENASLIADEVRWYKKYPDGRYEEISSSSFKEQLDSEGNIVQLKSGDNIKNAINITADMNQPYMTYYCAATIHEFVPAEVANGSSKWKEGEERKIYSIVLEKEVINSTQQQDVSIIFEGEDNFKYDANGDIAIEQIENAHSLKYKIVWANNITTQYKVSYYIGDDPIPQGEYNENSVTNPANSMLKNLWVDNQNIIWYNINEKFKNNYLNNTIKIVITTFDGEEFYFNKEILFLKDGDQGTNGTSYMVMIRPLDDNGQKTYKYFQKLDTPENEEGIKVQAFVYKDGERIDNNKDYTCTYAWNSKNLYLTDVGVNVNNQKVVKIYNKKDNNYSKADDNAPLYVKVSVTVEAPEYEGTRTIIINALYPFDYVSSTGTHVFDLSEVPQYIEYTSSGYNPTFNNIDLKGIYSTDNAIGGKGDNLMKPEAMSTNLIVETKTNETVTYYRLKPIPNFLGENDNVNDKNTMGVLKFSYDDYDFTVYRTIIMYLNTYGNEAINDWDGTSLKIKNDSGEEDYLLAPQVGAGEKNSEGTFTGVVMGKDTGQQKIGLYGYENGISTFGFKQDGTAYIGRAGAGRIHFDGDKAVIYGGQSNTSLSGESVPVPLDNSMRLLLSNQFSSNLISRPEENKAIWVKGASNSVYIKDDNGKYYYDSNSGEYKTPVPEGHVGYKYSKSKYSPEFTVDYAGRFSANAGEIGGWVVNEKSIKSSGGETSLEIFKEITETISPKADTREKQSIGTITTDYLKADKAGDIAGWKTGPLKKAITGEEDSEGKPIYEKTYYQNTNNNAYWIYGAVNPSTKSDGSIELGKLELGESVITSYPINETYFPWANTNKTIFDPYLSIKWLDNTNKATAGTLLCDNGNIIIDKTLIAQNVYLGQNANALSFDVYNVEKDDKGNVSTRKLGEMGEVTGYQGYEEGKPPSVDSALNSDGSTSNLGLSTFQNDSAFGSSIIIESGNNIALRTHITKRKIDNEETLTQGSIYIEPADGKFIFNPGIELTTKFDTKGKPQSLNIYSTNFQIIGDKEKIEETKDDGSKVEMEEDLYLAKFQSNDGIYLNSEPMNSFPKTEDSIQLSLEKDNGLLVKSAIEKEGESEEFEIKKRFQINQSLITLCNNEEKGLEITDTNITIQLKDILGLTINKGTDANTIELGTSSDLKLAINMNANTIKLGSNSLGLAINTTTTANTIELGSNGLDNSTVTLTASSKVNIQVGEIGFEVTNEAITAHTLFKVTTEVDFREASTQRGIKAQFA